MNKVEKKEYNRNYSKSVRGKQAHKKYAQSEKGRIARRRANTNSRNSDKRKEWEQSVKGKLSQAKSDRKYDQSKKGKVAIRKESDRRRCMIYTELFPNPLDEQVDWHHVSDEFIVAIPRDLHKLYSGYSQQKHRELVMNVVNQIYIEGV